jgi:hypothetical protein
MYCIIKKINKRYANCIAEIEISRVGPEQSVKRMEFDRENETGKIRFIK